MKYVEMKSNNVYYNLALEEYIFHNLKNEDYLLLWINDKSIVLGKHQNIFEEININELEKSNIKAARRNSGGGTVFHDSGNLNYTFITDYTPEKGIEYDKFLNPIIKALNSMGVPAKKRRICDIAIEEQKISGSAQSIYKDRFLHHGTLLFDTDINILHNILEPPKGKFTSKATKSVKSPVVNIKNFINDKSMTINNFKETILKYLFPNGIEYETLENEIEEVENLVKNKYSLWEWNFGASPKFIYEKSSIFENENIKITINVEKGIIKFCNIESKNLPIKLIKKIIEENRYSYSNIYSKLKAINMENFTDCLF